MTTTFCLYPFNYTTVRPSNSPNFCSSRTLKFHLQQLILRRRRSCSFKVSVVSSHSNPKILKSNRRSRFGQTLSPYDSDEEDGDAVDEDEEDDWFSDDEFSVKEDSETNKFRLKSKDATNRREGSHSRPEKRWGQSLQKAQGQQEIYNGKNTLEKGSNGFYRTLNTRETVSSLGSDGRKKQEAGITAKNRYRRLSEELELDERWVPLLDYLTTFGLKESHFIQMYERHMPSLQINVVSARERLEYLLSVGVKNRDIRKILLRQPQILEYTLENNLKSHVAFLVSLGIPKSRIGHIISATPSLFSYSVENSLKPTVRYLLEEVGIKKDDLSKVVLLSPQILVQRIDTTWNSRFNFLTRELGAPRDNIVKMVRKHPQILHYSIEDGLLPRINFLRSIGMGNSDIIKVLTSLTQVTLLSCMHLLLIT